MMSKKTKEDTIETNEDIEIKDFNDLTPMQRRSNRYIYTTLINVIKSNIDEINKLKLKNDELNCRIVELESNKK